MTRNDIMRILAENFRAASDDAKFEKYCEALRRMGHNELWYLLSQTEEQSEQKKAV